MSRGSSTSVTLPARRDILLDIQLADVLQSIPEKGGAAALPSPGSGPLSPAGGEDRRSPKTAEPGEQAALWSPEDTVPAENKANLVVVRYSRLLQGGDCCSMHTLSKPGRGVNRTSEHGAAENRRPGTDG
jgi:hypothetical protein